jgi:predicted AlkP superfamily phosphohydrolase/phosphomutase
VVAFDALDSDIALHYAEQGLLPVLRTFLAESTMVETRGAPGLFAGTVWPSLVTAVSPARHRRYYRWQQRLGQYADSDFGPEDIAAEPFWDTLSRAGRRVAVIDAPHSRLSRSVNGIHVVDWLTHDPTVQPALSQPAGVIDELSRRFGAQSADHCDDVERTPAALADFLETLEARIACKVEGARALLAREHWDLFFIGFTESHCVGHQLFHVHDSRHPLHDPALAKALGDPVLRVYRRLDDALGRLAADAGGGSHVAVLLSHGMGPAYVDENVVLDDVLRRIERARGAPSPSAFARLRRQWYRLPVGLRQARLLRGLRGRVLPALHRSLLYPERSTRRFFVVPNNSVAGAIRINLVGRDAAGRVRPEEYDRVCAELRDELLTLVDATTGAPWVRDVVRSRGRHQGPFADELPDLLVEWNRSHAFPQLVSPRLGSVSIPRVTGRSGDHVNRGAFLARGPGIGRGRRAPAVDVMDVAPTIAGLAGGVLENVDGTPIKACLP